MLNKLCSIGALLLCAVAHADTRYFHATYTGFYDQDLAVMLPDTKYDLYFSAQDNNADGTFSLDELLHFRFDLIGTAAGADVVSFSYTPGSAPEFFASMTDGPTAWVVSGREYVRTYADIPPLRYIHNWTPETQMTIQEVSAIPEPAAITMLGVGLAGLAGFARRRQGQVRPHCS